MRALSAAELLDVWERAWPQPLAGKALTLLAAASPDARADSLAHSSIGRRDSLLMTLRHVTFGSEVTAIANCPDCNEQLELAFDLDDIRVPLQPEDSLSTADTMSLTLEGFEVSFRLPDSLDLLAIASRRDSLEAREALIERCIVRRNSANLASPGARIDEAATGWLPEAVLSEIEEQMSKLDPQANVQLALDCPNCHKEWPAPFDILSFLWTEIDAWAARLLADVHTLASAYGWREADVLELSPARRNIYLSMVGT